MWSWILIITGLVILDIALVRYSITNLQSKDIEDTSDIRSGIFE